MTLDPAYGDPRVPSIQESLNQALVLDLTGAEYLTGRVLRRSGEDDLPIYGKALSFAAGPEAGSPVVIAHGIAGNFTLVEPIRGVMHTSDGVVQLPIPHVNYLNTQHIQAELILTDVALRTDGEGGTYSDYKGHVVLEYVKALI